MELYCTRPGCARPTNGFPDLDDPNTLKTTRQKFCTSCGMELFLQGRYLPLRLLGRGGFGAAFLARDRYKPGQRACVVKQFLPTGNLNPDQLALAQSLFAREAEVLDTLGNAHPQIPDLFAFFALEATSPSTGQVEEFFYLVQEYIDGEDLEQAIATHGPLTPAAAEQVLVEVLQILDFVHREGSIHRDIKPSNLIRRRDGLLFLVDFGAVKQATKAGNNPQKSTGIYSVGFAPPEQITGSTVYAATDFYALAVTCLCLMTGKSPEALLDSFTGQWQWQRVLPAGAQVSPTFAQVLERLLMPRPSDRYQSVSEIFQALGLAGQNSTAQFNAASGASSVTRIPAKGVANLQVASAHAVPPNPAPSSSASAPNPIAPNPIAPNPAPPQSAPQPLKPPPRVAQAPRRPAFSTLELLGHAGFTGFQGGLVAIALASLLGTLAQPLAWVLLLAVMGAIAFCQSRRLIERFDLPVIGVISLGVVGLLPLLHKAILPLAILPLVSGIPWVAVLILAGLAAAGAIATTSFFRLLYQLLSRLL